MDEKPDPPPVPDYLFYRLLSRRPCRACLHPHCLACWECHRCECSVYYKRPRVTRGLGRSVQGV